MMKLQLRKTSRGVLAMTDENGVILPMQVSAQVVAEKVVVEFRLGDGIELSNEPPKKHDPSESDPMKKLDPSEWRIAACDDCHVLIGIWEYNGYLHWTKVRV